MTSFTFRPASQVLFQFQPTLDGAEYNVILTWSLFGKRYYINIYALDGTLAVSKALVGSPTGVNIQSLVWARGFVTLTAIAPHNYKIGDTLKLTVSGVLPAAYSGVFEMLVTGPNTLRYALSTDPGLVTAFGSVSYDINLVAGYFATSRMVFRTASSQFEVTP